MVSQEFKQCVQFVNTFEPIPSSIVFRSNENISWTTVPRENDNYRKWSNPERSPRRSVQSKFRTPHVGRVEVVNKAVNRDGFSINRKKNFSHSACKIAFTLLDIITLMPRSALFRAVLFCISPPPTNTVQTATLLSGKMCQNLSSH